MVHIAAASIAAGLGRNVTIKIYIYTQINTTEINKNVVIHNRYYIMTF